MTRRRAKEMAARSSQSDSSDLNLTSETVAGSQGLDKSSELQSNSVSNTKKKKMSKKKSSDSVGENLGRDVSRDGDIGADASIAGKMVKGEEQLVLWRNPFKVIHYSVCELVLNVIDWTVALVQYRRSLLISVMMMLIFLTVHHTPSSYQASIHDWEQYLSWCAWWVGLGILSSVGLGTGLHTFLLYLGPHIAAVTMAAYECNSLEFPSPPYPSQILCPESVNMTSGGEGMSAEAVTAVKVTVWAILSKVRVEAFCWGAGTAIGELPPYFMARAARLSGSEPSEEEEEFLELQEKLKHPEKMTRFERAKHSVQQLVEKVGFFGILACASIPNPLFDLAGITCGHFLIPFWTFFGATLIGKAIIKMHIQKIFVILAFNNQLMETVISLLVQIPVVGNKLEAPVRALLAKQKEKLRGGGGDSDGSILSSIFEKFVLAMVAYFVVSIMNSLAQSYVKRLEKERKEKHHD